MIWMLQCNGYDEGPDGKRELQVCTLQMVSHLPLSLCDRSLVYSLHSLHYLMNVKRKQWLKLWIIQQWFSPHIEFNSRPSVGGSVQRPICGTSCCWETVWVLNAVVENIKAATSARTRTHKFINTICQKVLPSTQQAPVWKYKSSFLSSGAHWHDQGEISWWKVKCSRSGRGRVQGHKLGQKRFRQSVSFPTLHFALLRPTLHQLLHCGRHTLGGHPSTNVTNAPTLITCSTTILLSLPGWWSPKQTLSKSCAIEF